MANAQSYRSQEGNKVVGYPRLDPHYPLTYSRRPYTLVFEKNKKGKAFALATRNGQQMLKSFNFLEESKQETSEELASTKKYNLREILRENK